MRFLLLCFLSACVDATATFPDAAPHETSMPWIEAINAPCRPPVEIDSGFRCPPERTDTTCPGGCCAARDAGTPTIDASLPEIDSGFRCPPERTDVTCPGGCCPPIGPDAQP